MSFPGVTGDDELPCWEDISTAELEEETSSTTDDDTLCWLQK